MSTNNNNVTEHVDDYEKIKKEKIKKYKQEYFQKNKEKILKQKQEYRKQNHEKYVKSTQDYYQRTKETQKEKKKEWINNNREKYNSYWTNRKKNDVRFNLIINMRSRICNYLKMLNITKKNKTCEIIGCTSQQLKEHLEKQFTDGMNWENRNRWHIDHIIPLSSAKNEEELFKLFHYTKLQPLWAEDNLKKSNKIIT